MDRTYLELSDFKPAIYRKHPDLTLKTNEELENHYLLHGIQEGRVYNNILNRKDFIRLIRKEGKVMEIGPLDNPQLDHTSPNYHSIDVFNRAALVRNYETDPAVDKEKIVEPTYVIANNDYSPIKERFACIFSSHNIEHMPCLVVFLNNLHYLLEDDGLIYLIVPDKRYCFDHFKKETDIYDVLQSNYEKNFRPRFSDVLRMRTQGVHNDSPAHWNGDHGEYNPEALLLENYEAILQQYNTGLYMDAHVSFFTPQSFLAIIGLLNQLKLVDLKVHKIYHTLKESNEFYAILQKNSTAPA